MSVKSSSPSKAVLISLMLSGPAWACSSHYNVLPGLSMALAFLLLAGASFGLKSPRVGIFVALFAALGAFLFGGVNRGVPLFFSGGFFILALLWLSWRARRPPVSRISVAILGILWVGVLFAGGLSSRGPLTISDPCSACKYKLRDLGSALDMYAADHSGQYPDSLEQLTPDYLKSVPTCLPEPPQQPLRGFYESLYDLEFGPFGYESSQDPDDYRLWCNSGAHTWSGKPRGYPQYEGGRGLVERP